MAYPTNSLAHCDDPPPNLPAEMHGGFLLVKRKKCYTKSMNKQGEPKATPSAPLENLKSETKSSTKHGGKRSGSGRKTNEEKLVIAGLKDLIDSHANETIQISLRDRATGKTMKVKKPRMMIAIEKLFEIGTRGDGNAMALDKWMDRTVGKPLQGINLTGEIKVDDQRVPTKAEREAARAYRKALIANQGKQ